MMQPSEFSPALASPAPAVSPRLRLSQSHLNLLATCPRKFQHTYLDHLAAPPDPDQQARQQQGNRFHLLMQQWQMGLPVEAMLAADESLGRWFQSFLQASPEILQLEDDPASEQRQSEHPRTLAVQGWLITVVYDLLLTGRDRAKILDWKTYPRPRQPRWLLQNWQTRLYPYVLAATSRYKPAQISMVYWFFQSPGQQAETPEPQSVQLVYDADKHEQTRRDLADLLTRLSYWLQRYESGEPFPQVAIAESCQQCNFAFHCDVTPVATATDDCLNFADIAEVPL